jgi:hypothetical protein
MYPPNRGANEDTFSLGSIRLEGKTQKKCALRPLLGFFRTWLRSGRDGIIADIDIFGSVSTFR